ncbi:rRNA methyltransferase 2 [Cladobotryum mycophilum]|uniref:rRNA methyltransferase 2, mitochondrial n=1 Tax=Cladobotryum mycophilum TaxID=491253 RepID=A0ABR0SFS1_9HYPO
MDSKYKLFRSGQTVVDLVALERTRPNGRVIGIDLIPAQPPRGVATFQGDFLSPAVQQMVKSFIVQSHPNQARLEDQNEQHENDTEVQKKEQIDQPSYIDIERRTGSSLDSTSVPLTDNDTHQTRTVDIVLSDMSAPWEQTSGFGSNSLSNPYGRLMNTSGNTYRDHSGSMDLCAAALQFASDTLKSGGHLICKFYQGSEDKELEQKLKGLFMKVYREKPESSRSQRSILHSSSETV